MILNCLEMGIAAAILQINNTLIFEQDRPATSISCSSLTYRSTFEKNGVKKLRRGVGKTNNW